MSGIPSTGVLPEGALVSTVSRERDLKRVVPRPAEVFNPLGSVMSWEGCCSFCSFGKSSADKVVALRKYPDTWAFVVAGDLSGNIGDVAQ